MKTQNTSTKTDAIKAWAKQNGEEFDTITFDDADTITIGNREWVVLTDEEADEKAKEYIKDSAWAFNKSFLDAHSEAINAMDEQVYSKIQEMCESANSTVLKLLDDVDSFVEDAIASDGRGHFLAGYDGQEDEVSVGGTWFYFYRTN